MVKASSALDTALDKVVLLGYSKIGSQLRRRWWPSDAAPNSLHGKDIVVTGASSGLGRATAAGLAALGARVHLVGRTTSRLQDAADEIRSSLPEADLVIEECDVSDLDAIGGYCAQLEADLSALYAVVHCAGVMPEKRSETAQGHELALATHVFGPYAMTMRLAELLAATPASRVVWVSSGGMYTESLSTKDLNYTTPPYKGITAYARTKRMQVTLAELLAERLACKTVVHSMHPGWANTPGMTDSLPGFNRLLGPILRSPGEGADTIVWLVSAPQATSSSGQFWCDRKPRSAHYFPWQHDDPLQRRLLWQACVDATGLS